MDIDKILQDKVTKAHSAVAPTQAIDIFTILTIVTTLMDMIKNCRSPATAKSHMKRGSLVARLQARKALKVAKYQGPMNEMTAAVIEEGQKLTDEETAALFTETDDIPVPPASGPWPLIVAFLISTLFVSSAVAQQPWPTAPSKAWPTITEVDTKTIAHGGDTEYWKRAVDQVEKNSTPAQKTALVKRGPAQMRSWISTYKGEPWYVKGKTIDQHLVDHGFEPWQYAGLTSAEKHLLHGGAHTGKLDPRQKVSVPVSAAIQPAYSAAKPNVLPACPSGNCPLTKTPAKTVTNTTAQPVVRHVQSACPGGNCPLKTAPTVKPQAQVGGCPGGNCPMRSQPVQQSKRFSRRNW